MICYLMQVAVASLRLPLPNGLESLFLHLDSVIDRTHDTDELIQEQHFPIKRA